MVRVYAYAGCSTCRRALKFLDARGIEFEHLPIVDRPPTLPELKRLLGYLEARGFGLKQLFNTAGERYRALKVSDQLKTGLPPAEALRMLGADGKLIKRPVLLTAADGTVGFDEARWTEILDS